MDKRIILLIGIISIIIIELVFILVIVVVKKSNNTASSNTDNIDVSDTPTDDTPTDDKPTDDDLITSDMYSLDSSGNLSFTSTANIYILSKPLMQLFPNNYSSITTIDYTNISSIAMIPEDTTTYSLSGLYKDCSALTSITFGDNFNTSNITDMSSIFYNCSSLTDLNISNFNTSNVTNMSNMFYYCSKLEYLNLNNFDTSNVENMSGMFYGCSLLSYLNIDSFNTSNVKDMHDMFYGCSSLTKLSVINFDTSNVEDMSGMFSGCSSLTNLNVLSFDTSNVENMYFMFNGCSSLPYLSISSFNTNNVKNMSSMFNGCKQLSYLSIKSFDKSLEPNVNEMFTSVGSQSAYNTSSSSWSLFIDSTFLSYLINNGAITNSLSSPIPTTNSVVLVKCTTNNDISSINEIDGQYTLTDNELAFNNSATINVLTIPIYDLETEQYKNITSIDYTNISSTSMKDTDYFSLTHLYSGCVKLTKIEFGNNFSAYNARDTSNMFNNCSSLTSLNLSSFDMDRIIDMSYMFYGCKALTTIEFQTSGFYCGMNDSKKGSMESMFSGCSSLEKVYLPYLYTTYTDSMSYMFLGCESLSDINLSSFSSNLNPYVVDMFNGVYVNSETGSENKWKLTITKDFAQYLVNENALSDSKNYSSSDSITNPIFTCKGTTIQGVAEASIPYSINNGVLTFTSNASLVELSTPIQDLLTNQYENITSIDYSNIDPDVMTSKDSTYSLSGLYSGCSSLTSITFGDKFDTTYCNDMSYMFSGCSSLTELDLSGFNTSNVANMSGMFYECKLIKYINMLNNNDLKKINGSAQVEYMFYYVGQSNANTKNTWELHISASNLYKLVDYGALGVDDNDNNNMLKKIINRSEDYNIAATIINYTIKEINEIAETYVIKEDDNGDLTLTFTRFAKLNNVLSTPIKELATDNYKNIKVIDYNYITPDAMIPSDGQTVSFSKLYSKCESLTSITFGDNFNTEYVNDMSYMFYGCKALTELNIEGFDTSSVNDMSYMFSDCSSLTSLDLSNFNTSKVTDMCSLFNNCSSLTSLTLSSYFGKSSESDESVNVADMSYMFNNCSSLTSLTLPTYFGKLGLQKASCMFKNCLSLESIKSINSASQDNDGLKYLNLADVSDLSYMFAYCSSLTSLDITNWDTSNVEDMSYMFYGCESLTSLNISDFDTSNVTNMSYMFSNCSSFTELDLREFNTSKVTDMSYMFDSCLSLKELTISSKFTFNSEPTNMFRTRSTFYLTGINSDASDIIKTIESSYDELGLASISDQYEDDNNKCYYICTSKNLINTS